MARFEITFASTYVFEEGWGVAVSPVFSDEDEYEIGRVVDIDVAVVRIEESAVRIIGGVPCIPVPDYSPEAFFPIENFLDVDDIPQDDTHDLRSRFFTCEETAREHARYTCARFVNPSPWESFVKL